MTCPKYAYNFRTSPRDLPGYDPLIAVAMNFRKGSGVKSPADHLEKRCEGGLV